VVATITDAAGNASSSSTPNNLIVDTTATPTPTANPQNANTTTPTLTGTATVAAGDTFTVTVNGITYTLGDGNLSLDANGVWTLTIPPGDALPEGSFSVTATVVDPAGNSISDAGASELYNQWSKLLHG